MNTNKTFFKVSSSKENSSIRIDCKEEFVQYNIKASGSRELHIALFSDGRIEMTDYSSKSNIRIKTSNEVEVIDFDGVKTK